MERGLPWRDIVGPAFRRALTRVSIVILLTLLNPFEINEWSSQRSAALWQRLNADHYGPPDGKDRDEPGTAYGRDETTLVYIDDASLKAAGEKRPFPAYLLIDLIDDIRYAPGQDNPPRAIFLDLLMSHAAKVGQTNDELLASLGDKEEETLCAGRKPEASPFRCFLRHVAELTRYDAWKDQPRCRESTLARLLCIREAKGLPLLFADPRGLTEARELRADLTPSLEALDTVAALVPVTVDETDYPLVDPATHANRIGNPYQLYPAAALYALWCASKGERCKAGFPYGPDRDGRVDWSERYDRPLTVSWGVGRRSWFTDFLDRHRGGQLEQRCDPADPSPKATAMTLASMATSGINFERKPRCPYANAIPFDLLQGQVTAEEMAKLFADKIVIIGSTFADSNDIVRAPPFGQVPGVYYHAMALDNLIELGAGYPQPTQQIVSFLDLSDDDLRSWPALFITVLLVSIATAAMRHPPGHPEAPLHPWRSLTWRLLISMACVAVLGPLLFSVTQGSALLPQSANLVAIMLLYLIGIAELFWAALDPLREVLARHFAFGRLWHALTVPGSIKGRD